MREVPVFARGANAAAVARLTPELRALPTLGNVLGWLRAQSPARTVDGIVTQDEYTHDVIVVLEPRLALVFDVT